jgi:alpha-L-fucosidase
MRADATWFRQARWGAFIHFLSKGAAEGETVDSWNRKVDGFDAKKLAEQLVAAKAKFFCLTIGQNSGFFLSPNQRYDELVGRTPSRLSKRDLVADMIAALRGTDIRMMVYLPSHAPAQDRQAIEGLKCTPKWDGSQWCMFPGSYICVDGVDDRLTAFQRHWEEIIAEWSRRWGREVHGWWFDGCYYADKMYRSKDEPNFASFAAATKAGNPDSLVAFNPGVKAPIICYTEHEDYTAGELCEALPVDYVSPWSTEYGATIDGAQRHHFTFLGRWWGDPQPRFPEELVVGYTKYVASRGGVMMWDVGTNPDGTISDGCLAQLVALGKAMG